MKIKVLIADDDENFKTVLKARMADEEFQIQCASNGAEFFSAALSFKPDIILLDILLGPDYGPTVYNNLLAHGFDRNIPVIILSSLANDEPPPQIPDGRRVIMHHKFVSQDQLRNEIHHLLRT